VVEEVVVVEVVVVVVGVVEDAFCPLRI